MYGEDSCGHTGRDGPFECKKGRLPGRWLQLDSRALKAWAWRSIHIEGVGLGALRSSISTG